jgi:uncharacterized membrane protein YdbT with pleckstrin-like domain
LRLSAGERIRVDTRPHGIVLARPLLRAGAAAAAGAGLMLLPWPVPIIGAVLLAAAAVVGVAAVWRWDRTRLVVTTEKLVLAEGILRRHESTVILRSLSNVGLERSLTGRLLGYGTVVVGPLRVTHVAAPREVSELLEELIAA